MKGFAGSYSVLGFDGDAVRTDLGSASEIKGCSDSCSLILVGCSIVSTFGFSLSWTKRS